MARKPLFKSKFQPYHVFNRVISKDFYPPQLMHEIWEIYCNSARCVTWAYGARIHALVLMSNHFHLLISTPDGNIDQIMQYFQREISKQILKLEHKERYRFQSRYKWKIITDAQHYRNVYKYIFTNPHEIAPQQLCSHYAFSTMAGQCGNFELGCPIYENEEFGILIPADIIDREAWINLM